MAGAVPRLHTGKTGATLPDCTLSGYRQAMPQRPARLPLIPPALWAVVIIGGTIAAFAAFDVLFNAATGDRVAARIAVFVALALAGAWCAKRSGLRLEPHGTRRPVLTGLAAAIIIAAYIVVLDGVVFRQMLDPAYVEFLRSPLPVRLALMMLRAFNENVFYRLFVFSALVFLAGLVRRGAPLPVWLMVALAFVTQIINIWCNVVLNAPPPHRADVLAYDGLRYVVPGVVWAGLYRRFGFATAEVASVSCHAFLQPALTVLI
jgi:hypothetical protein